MKKKYGTLDGYIAADIMTFISIVLFAMFIAKKTGPKIFLLSFCITALCLCYAMLISKAVVKNNISDGGSVKAKGENSTEPFTCLKGEKISDVDGIKVAHRDGSTQVYKIPDGVHAVVTEDGTVKVHSLWGRAVYHSVGGKLSTPPDENWKPLFEC